VCSAVCNPSGRRSGDWEHAQRHGRGKLELSNGFVYDGGWVRNVMEGMMILGVVLIVLLLWQPYVCNFGATLLHVVKLSCLFTLRVLREDLRMYAISGIRACSCACGRSHLVVAGLDRNDTATVVLILRMMSAWFAV
jgi:hypothetical protein